MDCNMLQAHATYRVAKMYRMPDIAGLFSKKSHYLQVSFAENYLQRRGNL